jgi:hypothetical protein
MTHYLQNLIDRGIVTVETGADGKEVVRMTPETFQMMMTSSTVTVETKDPKYEFNDNSKNIIRKKDVNGENW